ncbi:hypothetical protein INR77_12080 [Erythrobacter sp. SCSIO 43205]|uniref:hypothetical protein n=1 Tax=Erythrobacter sp. SCSIO 43205 TaxID=2779361 RepID=UPI001CA96074|nr:hypothetical protein [Erythrobacter sp. SCSIO 43205]UAB77528.1 hypothetical protein INR77_12080 [Erythrobacter sp. SCSIO 43205]
MPPTAPSQIQVETGADMLRTMLDSQSLLLGSIAFGIIAALTVVRVSARRRKDRAARRESYARTQAIHDFLSTVRADTGSPRQGVWHYDFTSGAQQFSEELKALVNDADALKSSGVDLARVARQNSDLIEPYEATFHLSEPEGGKRPFMLRACNLRDGEGQIKRAVAIVREIERRSDEGSPSD